MRRGGRLKIALEDWETFLSALNSQPSGGDRTDSTVPEQIEARADELGI